MNVAGNSATAAATVRIDWTPPSLALDWPPSSPFQTDVSPVPFAGSASDAVSGLARVSIQGPSGTVDVGPQFSVVVPVSTSIPAGAAWVDSAVTAPAVDAAGNRAAIPVVVRYTTLPYAPPTDADRAAYDAISAPAAQQGLDGSGVPLAPTRVVVIDTGLDRTFGLAGEVADVEYVDMCDVTNTDPVDPSGHGSAVAAIVGGANNGYGANGLVSGLANGQFATTVVRTACDAKGNIDLSLVYLALEAVKDGELGRVSVVNMSFATPTLTNAAREQYSAEYARYLSTGSCRCSGRPCLNGR